MARINALAAFSNDPLVHAGVDLLSTRGVLTVRLYDQGLRSDQLHMNNFTANDAGTDWGNLLAAT